MSNDELQTDSAARVIVLLHGFAAHWMLMRGLQKYFERAGHRTINWGYNSWFRPIEFHGQQLHERLADMDADHTVDRIDFVTHSMGCIVTRAALTLGLPAKMGRWVMLAPPNRGSYLANSMPRLVRKVMKPLEQLQTVEQSYVNQLPIPQGVDIAVLQASTDYIVAEELTFVPQENARQVFPGLHSQLLFRKDVWEQSLYFLHHGRLTNRDSPTATHRDAAELSKV